MAKRVLIQHCQTCKSPLPDGFYCPRCDMTYRTICEKCHDAHNLTSSWETKPEQDAEGFFIYVHSCAAKELNLKQSDTITVTISKRPED